MPSDLRPLGCGRDSTGRDPQSLPVQCSDVWGESWDPGSIQPEPWALVCPRAGGPGTAGLGPRVQGPSGLSPPFSSQPTTRACGGCTCPSAGRGGAGGAGLALRATLRATRRDAAQPGPRPRQHSSQLLIKPANGFLLMRKAGLIMTNRWEQPAKRRHVPHSLPPGGAAAPPAPDLRSPNLDLRWAWGRGGGAWCKSSWGEEPGWGALPQPLGNSAPKLPRTQLPSYPSTPTLQPLPHTPLPRSAQPPTASPWSAEGAAGRARPCWAEVNWRGVGVVAPARSLGFLRAPRGEEHISSPLPTEGV